jgi:dCMP deaminase
MHFADRDAPIVDWDSYFLVLARHVARKSKDPSTRVGAVVTNARHQVLATGFNGFARGVDDHPARYADRAEKYPRIIHGEVNALLFANMGGHSTHGGTLYTWPLAPCDRCAAIVIQCGISRVVSVEPSADLRYRWQQALDLSASMLAEAGVTLDLLPVEAIEV